MATVNGTNGNNRLRGTAGDDTITARAGNDVLLGAGGDDILKPGTGSDKLLGGANNDLAVLVDLDPTGSDTYDGGGGRDTLDLRAIRTPFNIVAWDFDTQTGTYSATQWGEPLGTPLALTFTDVEVLLGGNDYDQIFLEGSTKGLTIDAGGGSDWVIGGSGDDIILGGIGNDRLNDFGGLNKIYGGVGDDIISGGTRLIDGGDGVDTASFSGSVDLVGGIAIGYGGERIKVSGIENLDLSISYDTTATIRGSRANNVIDNELGGGAVSVKGGGGRDTITGGDAADTISGGNGDDIVSGAFGSDTLAGGDGADTFRFADDFFIASRTDTGIDLVTDFARSEGDRIDVSGVDAIRGTDADDTFRFIGTAAFDGQAGELRYELTGSETLVQGDTNGDGAADFQIRIAGRYDLQASDFNLIAASFRTPGSETTLAHGSHAGSTYAGALAGPDSAGAAYVDPVLP